jgi:DNA-binding XRE family transcriptional regulator
MSEVAHLPNSDPADMMVLLRRIGWTQVYFANHVGVDKDTVYRWCKDVPNPVAMKFLELACRSLNV